MTVTLPDHFKAFVDEQVRSGRYRDADDVVTRALQLFVERVDLLTLDAAAVEAIYPGIREKIEEGWRSAETGQFTDGKAFFAGLNRGL